MQIERNLDFTWPTRLTTVQLYDNQSYDLKMIIISLNGIIDLNIKLNRTLCGVWFGRHDQTSLTSGKGKNQVNVCAWLKWIANTSTICYMIIYYFIN